MLFTLASAEKSTYVIIPGMTCNPTTTILQINFLESLCAGHGLSRDGVVRTNLSNEPPKRVRQCYATAQRLLGWGVSYTGTDYSIKAEIRAVPRSDYDIFRRESLWYCTPQSTESSSLPPIGRLVLRKMGRSRGTWQPND